MKRTLTGIALALMMAGAAAVANATAFSFTGNLANDDDVQLFNFSVGSTSNVTFRTFSYAGGTNAAGTVIPAGGFDPILALFDNTGALLNVNDDGGSGTVPTDPVTGAAYDTYMQSTLGTGTYTVAVMQYANFPVGPNLSDGFQGSGTTNFTDFTGHQRTSFWAFDITGVDTATQQGGGGGEVPAPEPSSLSLMLLGAIGVGAARLRRRRAS